MASVTLSWSRPASGAVPTKYFIYRLASTSAGTADETVVGTTENKIAEVEHIPGQDSYSYEDSAVSSSDPGPFYSYTVSAYNTGGESTPHDPAKIADLS